MAERLHGMEEVGVRFSLGPHKTFNEMSKRNIITIIIGTIVGLIPIYTALFFWVSKYFLIFTRPIYGGLIAEWIYEFTLGIVIYVISRPKKYYLIPIVGFPIAIVATLNNYLTDSFLLSATSVFLSFLFFGSMGYLIAKLVSTRFAKSSMSV